MLNEVVKLGLHQRHLSMATSLRYQCRFLKQQGHVAKKHCHVNANKGMKFSRDPCAVEMEAGVVALLTLDPPFCRIWSRCPGGFSYRD